jgi:glycosyltransferase 2 family protein
MPAAPRMRRLLGWLGALIVALSLYYVGSSLVGQFDELLALEWERRGITVTLAGTVAYTLSLVALAVSWTVIALGALPDGRQLAIATRVYARSGIAKYLPGNVFHLVGRQLLGRALGVSQARLAVATAAEIALSLLSVWLVAAAVFAALPGPISRGPSVLALLLGVLAAIAFVSPKPLRRLVPLAAPALERMVGDARGLEFGVALALNLAFFLCLALIAGSVFCALTGQAQQLMQVGAVYLCAWLAGYIVPGASGGLGVREAALLVLMDDAASQPAVLAFALAMRVQSTLGDLCFFAASYALPSAGPEPVRP